MYVNTYKDAEDKDVNDVATHKKDSKSKKVALDNLSNDELAQVLHIAQSQATSKAKKKIFK